jgi:hypothetical protein
MVTTDPTQLRLGLQGFPSLKTGGSPKNVTFELLDDYNRSTLYVRYAVTCDLWLSDGALVGDPRFSVTTPDAAAGFLSALRLSALPGWHELRFVCRVGGTDAGQELIASLLFAVRGCDEGEGLNSRGCRLSCLRASLVSAYPDTVMWFDSDPVL